MAWLAFGEGVRMIADRMRANLQGFYDYFERSSIGEDWDTSGLASATITDGKLVTEGNTYTWDTYVGAKYTGSLGLNGDFVIEADLEWVARSSDIANIVVALFDSSDNVLAYGGMRDAWTSRSGQVSCGILAEEYRSGFDSRPASGTMVIRLERSGSTLYIYEDGNLRLSGTMTSIVDYIVLTNERSQSYNGKTAKWDYVTIRW